MKKDNQIADKSKAFAIRIIRLYKYLTSETEYWHELLEETEYIPEDAGKSMHEDCKELLKMITAILKTTKDNQSK